MMVIVLFTYIIKEIIWHIRLKFSCGVEKTTYLIFGAIDISINIKMLK